MLSKEQAKEIIDKTDNLETGWPINQINADLPKNKNWTPLGDDYYHDENLDLVAGPANKNKRTIGIIK